MDHNIFYDENQETQHHKNYVSLHLKNYKAPSYNKLKNHNNRKSPPDYLLTSELIEFENFERSYNDFHELKKQHSEIMKKKGTGLQKSSTLLSEGVLSFSAAQMKKIGNPKQLEEAIEIYMKKLEQEFGLKPISFTFHADEGFKDNKEIHNYHAHIQFYNFDFEKERAVIRNLKSYDFEKMQDIAGEVFKEFGFIRGKSKKETKRERHETEEYKELEDVKKLIEQQREEYNKLIELNKRAIQATKTRREELKSLDIDINLKKEEYTRISEEQKQLREEAKGYRRELKIFEKFLLPTNEQNWTDEDRELLKILAPAMFEILELKTPKEKQQLSNELDKAFNNRRKSSRYMK